MSCSHSLTLGLSVHSVCSTTLCTSIRVIVVAVLLQRTKFESRVLIRDSSESWVATSFASININACYRYSVNRGRQKEGRTEKRQTTRDRRWSHSSNTVRTHNTLYRVSHAHAHAHARLSLFCARGLGVVTTLTIIPVT